MNEENEKRVDESWKDRAQQEKRRLDDEQAGPDKAKTKQGALPKADFITFMTGLGTQALVSMGAMNGPAGTGEPQKDIEQAKYYIDLLQVMKEKTKGNLTDTEEKYLDSLLYDLRMRYVTAAG